MKNPNSIGKQIYLRAPEREDLEVEKKNFARQTRLDKSSTIISILISIIFNVILKIKHKFGLCPESLNIMQIRLLGSNHTRRAQFFSQFLYQTFSKIIYRCKVGKKDIKLHIKKEPIFIYKSKYHLQNDNLNQVIFCGDSHVEFFTRSNLLITPKRKLIPLSIWLGPKTLVGFASEKKTQKHLVETLGKLEIKNTLKKRLIIFCLGSIDVRTTIGFLLASRTFKLASECIEFITRYYVNINEGIMKELGSLRNTKIAFLSIPPASPSKGIDFLKCSPKEALKYQNEAAFTTFGSPVERSEWTCLLNNAFKSIANERGWIFIDNSKAYELVTDQKNYFIDKKYTFDHTHIHEPEMNTQTIIQCIKRMHNSYIQ